MDEADTSISSLDRPAAGTADDLSVAPDALGAHGHAVLGVLLESAGRVVSRHELARRSGLSDRSERRCDAILVQLRRALGPDAIRTVRSRGWMLTPDAVPRARVLHQR